MRGFYGAIAALTALSVGAAPAMTVDRVDDPLRQGDVDYFPKQRRGKGQNNRRGKGKSNPPKSHPNRLTISKRVRRKHRRAA